MLSATVIGFDGETQVYSSDDHAAQRMDDLFARLAGGVGYEVEVSANGQPGGAVFGADIYDRWTLADEAQERGAGRTDQAVTYRLLPETSRTIQQPATSD